MSNLFWLTDDQLRLLEPFFPKSPVRARVDDRRVLSSIIFVNRNGPCWPDAPAAYDLHKTNRRRQPHPLHPASKHMIGAAGDTGDQEWRAARLSSST